MKFLNATLAALLLLFVISAKLTEAFHAANQYDYLHESGDAYPQNENLDYDYDADENVESAAENEETNDGPPPVFAVEPQHIEARKGTQVQIPCTLESPTNYILMFKKLMKEEEKSEPLFFFVGDMRLVGDKRISIKDNVVTLNRVNETDAGHYSCLYQLKPPVEVRHYLDVQYPPEIIKSSEDKHVLKGETVTLECATSGNPTPTITWAKLDGKMPSGENSEEGISMTLADVDRHVEGVYTCNADNGIGESVSAQMSVTVDYAPEIITEEEIIRTGEGDKVALVCIVHARPSATLTWTKNGEPVDYEPNASEHDGGHRHVLEISHVTEQNFGSYKCSASNKYGETEAIISLTDLPKQPIFTSNPNSAEDSAYTITWNTESYYPIKEYLIRYRKTKANESSEEPGAWSEEEIITLTEEDYEKNGLQYHMRHTIKNLEPATDYQALVQVKNKDRWGEEAYFTFSTKKASPTTTSTTTTKPHPMNLAEIPQNEEVTSHQTTAGSGAIFGSMVLVLISSIAVPYCS